MWVFLIAGRHSLTLFEQKSRQQIYVCKTAKKMLCPSYIILSILRLEEISVDLDKVAITSHLIHYEQSHQDLHCLRIPLYSFGALSVK